MSQLGFSEEIGVIEGSDQVRSTVASTGPCELCDGEMQQIAPRGWHCQANSFHRFELLSVTEGIWRDVHPAGGKSLLASDLPAWAQACTWTAVGYPNLDQGGKL